MKAVRAQDAAAGQVCGWAPQGWTGGRSASTTQKGKPGSGARGAHSNPALVAFRSFGAPLERPGLSPRRGRQTLICCITLLCPPRPRSAVIRSPRLLRADLLHWHQRRRCHLLGCALCPGRASSAAARVLAVVVDAGLIKWPDTRLMRLAGDGVLVVLDSHPLRSSELGVQLGGGAGSRRLLTATRKGVSCPHPSRSASCCCETSSFPPPGCFCL